jgi:hypothetical protein
MYEPCPWLLPQPIVNKRKVSWSVYSALVWRLTSLQPIHLLEHYEKRAYRGYHLDHILSVWQGFTHGIPAHRIASLTNLRFIPAKANMRKGRHLTSEARKRLEAFERSAYAPCYPC